MEYFYTLPDKVKGDHLIIEGEEYSHLTHVMRRSVGDELRVVDGRGNVYDAVITSVEKRAAHCAIRARFSMVNEAETDITLAAGLLKNSAKFDFLVEKATELGVISIVPLFTERSIPRHAKVERWQKLALAAMKQSCRCILPKVSDPKTFNEFVVSANRRARLIIPHEKAGRSLRSVLSAEQAHQGTAAVVICIGPEGGFSDAEIEMAKATGFTPVNLGPRRLRTETAAIVSVAAMQLSST